MRTKIYQSDAQLKMSMLAVWSEMIGGLMQSRELIWSLFVRDFLAKYKQAVLGILWAVIMPLAVVAAFVFMNRAGVLNVGKTEIPYPAYALTGLTIWQLFATGLTAGTNSIVAGGSMVVKINFPKITLVIASFAQSVFDFLVRIILVVAVFAYYRVVPEWTVIFLPLALIPLALFTLAWALMFSLLNCVARDTVNIVTLVTTFLLFLTPVLYPAPASGVFTALNRCNPLGFLIGGARDLVISGGIGDSTGYFWSVVFSVVIFLVSWRIFHLVEPRMAERV